MSTAVQHKVYESMFFSSSLSPQILEDFSVVGEELQLKEAFKVHDKFDKFVIFVAHGDIVSVNQNDSACGSLSDMSLSGKVSHRRYVRLKCYSECIVTYLFSNHTF
jgi:hypothetical protein